MYVGLDTFYCAKTSDNTYHQIRSKQLAPASPIIDILYALHSVLLSQCTYFKINREGEAYIKRSLTLSNGRCTFWGQYNVMKTSFPSKIDKLMTFLGSFYVS